MKKLRSNLSEELTASYEWDAKQQDPPERCTFHLEHETPDFSRLGSLAKKLKTYNFGTLNNEGPHAIMLYTSPYLKHA